MWCNAIKMQQIFKNFINIIKKPVSKKRKHFDSCIGYSGGCIKTENNNKSLLPIKQLWYKIPA